MSDSPRRHTVRLIRTLLLAVAALVVAPPIGIVLSASAIAIGVVRSRYETLPALGAAAFLAGWLLPGGNLLAGAVGAALVVLPGAAAGYGLRRRWSYARIVTVVTVAFAALLAAAFGGLQPLLESSAGELSKVLDGADRAGYSPRVLAIYEVSRWSFDHWREIFAGCAFAAGLIYACATATAATTWLASTDAPVVIEGAFRLLRPPDWAVWLVIAAALVWFADQRWPNDVLRVTSWNASLALFGLYWVNGLSIVVYAVHVLKPNVIVAMLLAFVMVLLGLVPLLGLVGLFDTWGEFRRKFDDVATAKSLRENSRDDAP